MDPVEYGVYFHRGPVIGPNMCFSNHYTATFIEALQYAIEAKRTFCFRIYGGLSDEEKQSSTWTIINTGDNKPVINEKQFLQLVSC